MRESVQSLEQVNGFAVGQTVWFIRHGLVCSGRITAFTARPADAGEFRAEVQIVDDLSATLYLEDLFTGEVDATQSLLDESVRQVSFLRLRLRELAKQRTAKAKKAAAAAQEGGRP